MACDGSRARSRNSSPIATNKSELKKGPWSGNEDMMLMEYVKRHGEGNWNAVQRNTGLTRCGKSCRLRWANHLRPNLKKGAFSPDEERLILELHARIGNKWARMAAQLPGRTDNEIKNYWNTRVKRRQRAGLPIYPQEVQHELNPFNNSSPPNSFSSLLNSSHSTEPNPFLNPQFNLYRSNNGTLALSLAARDSSFSSSTPLLYRAPTTPQLVPYKYLGFGIGMPNPNIGMGFPPMQSPAIAAMTPSASSSNFLMTGSSDDGEEREVNPNPRFSGRKNTGLLDDMIGESQGFNGNVKPTEESFVAAVNGDMHEKAAFDMHDINGKGKKAAGNNQVDDDLLNLLDSFPLSVPIPEWNGGNENESSDVTNGTSDGAESQPNAQQYNSVANVFGAANQDWNFGANLWNNMPSIY